MWPFKPKTTVSLLHHEYLLERSEEAKIIREEVDSILKEFNQGNFGNMDRFERLIEQAFLIIEHNIELYTKEKKRLRAVEEIITRFFQSQLFDLVEDEVLEKVQQDFQEKLQKALTIEQKHGDRPVSSYFRTLFKENKELDKRSLSDAHKLLNLHKDEKKVRDELYNLMMVFVREDGVMGSSLKRYEDKLSRAIEHFVGVVAQEFRALYDIEVDATLQEADLIKEIDLVCDKKIPRQHKIKLNAIKKKIDWFMKKEVKRIKNQAKSLAVAPV